MEVDGAPLLVEVQVRRYRCTACGATQTVVPAEVLTRRLYSASALVWALALWGIDALTAAAVRARVSPWRVVGAASATRWDALRRWARSAKRGALLECVRAVPATWTLRQAAARTAATVASFALPTTEPPSLAALAFRGAERAR